MSHEIWRGRFPLVGVTDAAVLSIVGGDLAAQQQESFTISGSEVAIYNLAGELRVEPSSGSAVVVEVTRGGRDAGDLRVATGPKAGLQTLRVIYPGDHVVYRGPGARGKSSLDVAADGTFGNDHGAGWLEGRRHVTVSGSGSGTEAWADLRVLVPKGQSLRLHLAVGGIHIGAVEGALRVDAAAATVEARGVRGKLVADTGSGEVMLDDIRGDVSLDTGSGTVVASGIRGSRLLIDTGSGDVRVHEVAVDRLSADTGSGGVTLEAVAAPEILLDTGSGHVDLDLSGDVQRLEVDTGSGGVTMRIPSRLGAEFDIETGSGGIEVDVPHQSLQVERDHVRGRIGDGRGRIHIDTGSGGVRLMRRTISSQHPVTIFGALQLPIVG